jgi:hypothetical protein
MQHMPISALLKPNAFFVVFGAWFVSASVGSKMIKMKCAGQEDAKETSSESCETLKSLKILEKWKSMMMGDIFHIYTIHKTV